jgi:hypothetical protein
VNLEIDPDVLAVMAFMQRNVAGSKLVAVANGVRDLANIAWGSYEKEDVSVLLLREPPMISVCDPHTQSSASEPRLAA